MFVPGNSSSSGSSSRRSAAVRLGGPGAPAAAGAQKSSSLVLSLLSFIVLYYAAAKLGLSVTIDHISLFWAGNGVAIVFLLHRPWQQWGWYLCSTIAVLILARWDTTKHALAAQLGLCNCVELIIGTISLKLTMGPVLSVSSLEHAAAHHFLCLQR